MHLLLASSVSSLPMPLWQALFLAVLQGVSELFPVSSLAQTILIPALLHWNLQRNDVHFLAFVVALHLATAAALLVYFWRDWREVIAAFIGSLRRGKLVYDRASKFAWLLVAGTIIVGAIGLLFEKRLRQFFENDAYVWAVAALLIINGFMMMFADAIKRWAERTQGEASFESEVGAQVSPQVSVDETQSNAVQPSAASADNAPGVAVAAPAASSVAAPVMHRKRTEDMTFVQGALVGASQTLALLPGISRSGVTIVAGLLAGLTYEEASRFSFMLATPIIGLAALLKVPELFKPEQRSMLHVTIIAAIVSGVTAYLSVRFLMRYFRNHRLGPFGIYCIVFGVLCLILLRMHY